MQFTLESSGNVNLVLSYEPGEICIGEEKISHNIILTPDRVLDWTYDGTGTPEPAHLEPVLALEPEVIVFGCGTRLVFPDASLALRAGSAGVGFEVMDTAAACRTYNLLVHEGRNVAAALIVATKKDK